VHDILSAQLHMLTTWPPSAAARHKNIILKIFCSAWNGCKTS